jgi:hypothetical protein
MNLEEQLKHIFKQEKREARLDILNQTLSIVTTLGIILVCGAIIVFGLVKYQEHRSVTAPVCQSNSTYNA